MKEIVISDLGKIVTGNTPPRSKPEFYGSFTPFIKATDISESEKYTYQPEECYSEIGYRKYIKSLIPKDSTCVVTIGSIGKKLTMAHCDCFINQAMNAIIPNDRYDAEYVYYLLKYSLANLKALDSGTASGRENVSKKAFSNMSVSVEEDKAKQEKIGKILSAYDTLIENNQKQIKLLEEAAQRLYKEWFVDMHFPGFETAMLVDGLPKGWKKKRIDSIVSLKSGFAFKSSTFDENGKYKLVTIKNVKDGVFDGDNLNHIATIPERMPEYCFLQGGDILLSLTGNVGRVCLVSGTDYLLNQRVAKLKSDYTAFAYTVFRSREMFTAINNLANGAAQQNVSPIRIGQMLFVMPTKDLIEKFEFIVSKNINKILTLQSQLRLLAESRDRLLPKLMSGELQVNP